MTRYLFANSCANLRSNGGEVSTLVHLRREPGRERYQYEGAYVHVTLRIPFTFSGESLTVVARASRRDNSKWVCYSHVHRRAKIEQALNEACERAIIRASKQIYETLGRVRPTSTTRKRRRKTNAVLKLLTTRNFTNS